MQCLFCGKDNAAGKTFCTECGSRLPPGQITDRKCPRCGASVAAHKSFCTQCGANLSSAQSTPSPPPPPQPSARSKAASGGPSASKAVIGIVCILGVAFAGWWVVKRSELFSKKKPSGPHILVSRLALSNGRTMTVRPISQANPMGLRAVAGFGKPDAVPPVLGLLTTIAAEPNPMRITLDKDGDGQVDPPTPKSVAGDAANLLTCFSLLVAEDFPAEGVRWENIIDRDLRGGLYATVDIPSANIFAGMPLITDDELRAYTANSIIYEAPDYGISPATVDNPKGGRIKLRAAPRPQPSTPNVRDLIEAPEINYAIDVKVDIEVVSTCKYDEETIKLTLRANTTGFDPLPDSWFRWAYDGYNAKIVKDVQASNEITFFIPAKDEGRLISIWVAVSSKGLFIGNPNPFVQTPPEQFVGNMTFVTVGSAVSTMLPHTLTPKGKCDEDRRKTGPGSYRLARTKIIRRFCEEGPCTEREELLDGAPSPIKYSASESKENEYDMDSTLTVDAPLSVVPMQDTPVTATLEVTWNWRQKSNFWKQYLSDTWARLTMSNISELKALGSSDVVMTTGQYNLSVTHSQGKMNLREGYTEFWIYAEIRRLGLYGEVNRMIVVLIYEPVGDSTGKLLSAPKDSSLAARIPNPRKHRFRGKRGCGSSYAQHILSLKEGSTLSPRFRALVRFQTEAWRSMRLDERPLPLASIEDGGELDAGNCQRFVSRARSP